MSRPFKAFVNSDRSQHLKSKDNTFKLFEWPMQATLTFNSSIPTKNH